MICPHCLFEHVRPLPRCGSCGRTLPAAPPQAPFVGRARELALLDQEFDSVVKTRSPRIVGVVGAARVGVSRLLAEFQRRHDNAFNDIEFLRGHAVPGGVAVDPLLPLGRLLRNAFKLDETWPPSENEAQARSEIDALDPPSLPDALRALGFFLGLRFEEILFAEPTSEGPDEERRHAFGWFAWLLRRRAARRPVVILLEHFHDATPEALDLLAYLHTNLTGVPLLILAEVRRERFEHEPAFFLRYGDGVVVLDPLGDDAVGDLLMRLTDRPSPPPPNLLSVVAAATGGLPDAVVQVARTLLERGVVQADRAGWGVDPDDADLSFPFALTSTDEARRRLDGLDPEDRAWLRRAAVVGPVFRPGVLTAIARLEHGQAPGNWVEQPSADEIDAALGRCETMGLLHRMHEPGDDVAVEFAFTRALEQSLLLEETPLEDRAAIHAVVAQWLEYQPGPERDALLWQIAEHAQLGGNEKRAAFFYIRAGERARRRFANGLAVEAFERAQTLLDHRDALPLMDVLHALGVLYSLDGFQDRAERAFERMLSLAWSLDHKAKAGAALNRLGRLYRDRCRYERAVDLLDRGRALFERADDGPGVAASIDDLGQVAWRQGEREAAVHYFEEALKYRRSLGDERSVGLSLTNLARVNRDRGLLLTAETQLREALEIRQRIDDAGGLVTSRLELAALIALKGEPEVAWREVTEALNLARRIGDRTQTARALALSALLLAEQGALETAREQAEEAAALAEQLGDLAARLQSLRALGMGLATAEPERALTALEAAARLARQNGHRLDYGLALRLVGALYTRLSGVDVHAVAEEMRDQVTEAAGETAEGSMSGQSSIDMLIDDALKDEGGAESPHISPAARQQLLLAVDTYTDAIAVLEAIMPEQEQETINALRELAVIVEALGERTRARSLERRARRFAAARRDRLLQDC